MTNLMKWGGSPNLGENKVRSVLERAIGPVGGIQVRMGCFLIEMSAPQAERFLR